MKPIHGKILMGTGVLHSGIVAPLIYWAKWSQFLGTWLFDVSPHSLSAESSIVFSDIRAEAAIWFFIGGILFFMLGQLMHCFELKAGTFSHSDSAMKSPCFISY